MLKDKVTDEDTEILMDFLLSILSIENKDLRRMVEDTMKQFVPLFKQETINHLVSEIFTPLDLADNPLIDETVDSESDVDLEENAEEIIV